jgi:acyl-CoA thioesterase FadM
LVEPIKFDTPVIAYGLRTEQAWFDPSGALSPWGMTRIFDRIAASGFDILDCGEAYRARSGCAMAPRQAMTTYLEPVRQATPLRGAFRLLDASAAVLHVYLEIYDALGRLAAVQEALYALSQDDDGRDADFTEAQRADIAIMLRYHASLPKPKYRGRLLALETA